MWNSVLVSVTVLCVVLAVSEVISTKTRGILSTILIASCIYVAGYFTGIIPRTTPADTGLIDICGNFGLMIIITNLGTMITLKKLIQEWRVVALCIGGLAVLGIVLVTVGSVMFGKEYALLAYPPIAGGAIATAVVADAATVAGAENLAGFAWLVSMLQDIVAIPMTSVLMSVYCQKSIKRKKIDKNLVSQKYEEKSDSRFRLVPEIPEKYNTMYVKLAKILVITLLCIYLGEITGISSAILCLVLGMLFYEIGFLDKNTLQSCGIMNFLILALLALGINAYASMTPERLSGMLTMAVEFEILGAVALIIGGIVCAKLFRMDPILGAVLSLDAMMGFPLNMIITEDVIRSMELSVNETERLRETILPKIIIAGFTSVSIMSVVIAGMVVPFLY